MLLTVDEYTHGAKECLMSVLGSKVGIQYAAESYTRVPGQLATMLTRAEKKPRSLVASLVCSRLIKSVVRIKTKLVNKIVFNKAIKLQN